MRGLAEIWLKNRRIQVSEDEYDEIKAACKPEAFEKELEIATVPARTPEELTESFERNIEMAEKEVVEEIRQHLARGKDTAEYEDRLYKRVDKDKVECMVRRARAKARGA